MLVSPAAERNKELILEVLADYVDEAAPAFGLELASGTGQHVVHFAQALPSITWQPSEISPAAQERYWRSIHPEDSCSQPSRNRPVPVSRCPLWAGTRPLVSQGEWCSVSSAGPQLKH
uniref:Methyltransferase like 26 n=1 Tax=Sphenodon punctatus TaxID=8508 RepID=A0A8D0H2J4_SPHPU